MKKIGSALVNLRLWRPGAALMRQLRFPGKMALISAAFMLPLAWLLGVYLHNQHNEKSFVALERQGVRYALALYPALDAAGVWRQQARNAAFGQASTQVDAARSRFDSAWAAVEALDRDLGPRLATQTALAQVRRAVEQARSAQGSPDAVFAGMIGVSRGLVSLLDTVADSSGLILDPELPTYHLMSAALIRGPQVIQHTVELRGLGRSALQAGQLTPDNAARLQAHLAVLDHELQLAKLDLAKMQAAAPEHGRRLMTQAPAATEAFVALVRQTFPPGQADPKGDVAAYVSTANQTLDTQFAQVQKNLAVLDQMLAERESRIDQGLWLALALTLAGLLLAGYLFMGFYRSLAGGFKVLRRHLINISMGDLRGDIRGDGRDEVAGMLKELGNMQLALRETVQQVQATSDTVVGSSIEIAQGTHDLSARTESAAAALEESSAALEQTTSTVQMTAESVKKASDIAQDNAGTATRGGQVMQDVVVTMERIQASSQKISDIIGVIDGIAFQTNILALNAAVEAARAGEQGRGFAVVAGEVRALAQRSAEAAREIKTLITSSSEEVERGTGIVRQAGTTMGEIVHSAQQVRQLLDEVANGAREQSLGISQIGVAVQELDRNTQANAALVEQTAAAADTQRSAAVRMAAQVDEFRLPGSQAGTVVEGINVDGIIDAHRQWKVKLRDAIETGASVDVQTLSRDDCCALGKWVYGDGQRLAGRPTFTELVGKHAHFHKVAGQVGELINQGRFSQAEDALAPGTPFSSATSEVVLVLSSAKRLGF